MPLFLQLFRITVIERTVLHVAVLAVHGWGFVSQWTLDCILVGLVLLVLRFWGTAWSPASLHWQQHADFQATTMPFVLQSGLLVWTKPLLVCGICWKRLEAKLCLFSLNTFFELSEDAADMFVQRFKIWQTFECAYFGAFICFYFSWNITWFLLRGGNVKQLISVISILTKCE